MLDRPPFGRAWDRYIRASSSPWVDHRGPYTGARIDPDDWELLEHVRTTGRLRGAGALGAWDVSDYRAPVIEPTEIVLASSQRAERLSRKADRARAAYLTDEQIAHFAEIRRRNNEAMAKASRQEAERRLKYAQDAKTEAEELEHERRAWRGEQKRWARSAQDREERWKAEQATWDQWEQKERRRDVKLTRLLKRRELQDAKLLEQARKEEEEYRRATRKARTRWERKEETKGMRKLWVARHAIRHLRKAMREHYRTKGFYEEEIQELLERGQRATEQMIKARDFHGWGAIKRFTSSS